MKIVDEINVIKQTNISKVIFFIKGVSTSRNDMIKRQNFEELMRNDRVFALQVLTHHLELPFS